LPTFRNFPVNQTAQRRAHRRRIPAGGHLTEAEMRTELAVVLYQKRKLPMGKAAKLAGIPAFSSSFCWPAGKFRSITTWKT